MRNMRYILLVAILTASVSGCVDKNHESSSAWTPPSVGDGWSVSYRSADGTMIVLQDAQTVTLPIFDQPVREVRMSHSEPVTVQRTFWSAGAPLASFAELQGVPIVDFLSASRPALTELQVLAIPQIVDSPFADSILPNRISVQDWKDALRNAKVGEAVELHSPILEAPILLYLDEAPWPLTIEVPSCEACLSALATPGRYQREAYALGGPVLAWPSSQPAKWFDAIDRTSGILPFPNLDPGGLSVSVGEAVERSVSLSDSIREFVVENPGWRLVSAQFAGSNATGQTEWHLSISDGGNRKLSWTYTADFGSLNSILPPTISAPTEDNWNGAAGDLPATLAVPNVELAPRPMHPCDGPGLPVQIIAVSYQLGEFGLAQGYGSLVVTVRGLGPGCVDSTVITAYGIDGPTVLLASGPGLVN